MNTSVTFPIAKLLKEKGFEENTEYAFKSDGTKVSFKSHGGVNANLNYNIFRQNNKNPLTSAPTISEAVMWLYKKHDIWITVERHDPKGLFNYVIVYQDKIAIKESRDKGYNSPTEAYLAAIEHTLITLIK